MSHQESSGVLGCLLGTAIGDSLGLPVEGMSKGRIARLWKRGRHGLFFGRGMFSDDTEHSLMISAALIRCPDDIVAFQSTLGWKLRWWLLALPAGVGFGTARAIVRLWLGSPAHLAGVKSAGNGAAMRSAILGAVFRKDPDRRRDYAKAACRLTHADSRAEESAILVAEAAALAANQDSEEAILETLNGFVTSEEMRVRFTMLKAALAARTSVAEFAKEIGCGDGVTGFAPNTVAVALYAWLRHRGDFEAIITEVISCGGDTDTVAAIAGGISGSEVGEEGMPPEWVDGMVDWPRSVAYIRKLADALNQRHRHPPFLFWPAIPFRNFLFLMVVLLHGFRRLLPPY